MTVTWDQLAFLSPAQQAKAAQFAVIGTALNTRPSPGNPNPPPVDTSTVTYSQAKAARALLADLQALVGPAVIGINYVIKKGQDDAATAFDQANP